MTKSECSRIPIPLLLAILALLGTLGQSSRAQARDRLPLQKKAVEISQPAPVTPEFEGYDKAGKAIYWDPRPHVIPLGDGKYAFKWIGHSGRELTLIYQRPDVVDLVVEASVAEVPRGRLTYRYSLHNLRTSKLWLGGFSVQTFSPGAQGVGEKGIYVAARGGFLKEFSVGRWLAFGMMGREPKVAPGATILVELKSEDLPGVVECRASAGDLTMKGVGEEPPNVLEDLYLRHDAWPHGYTIGPDERLAKMSPKERTNYLVERLPQMLELGWIENQKVMQWYETNLKAGKVAEVRARAEADFKKNLITSEVLALMTYLTR